MNHVKNNKTHHKEELRIYKVRWWYGDIINCFPRPMKWVSVCFNYNNISAVLVTGGVPTNSVGTSVELLSSNGTRLCSLPNLPAGRWMHSQTGLISCGGNGGSQWLSCVTFSAGRWRKTHTLGQRRSYHSAWASPRGVLLMGGGYSDGDGTTTELLTDNGGSTPSFSLAKHKYL